VGKVTDFFVMGGAKWAKARGENRGCSPTVYKKPLARAVKLCERWSI